MMNSGESKLWFGRIGLGLGAVAGLMAAILARKETRELLRERSGKTLDYLNQQAGRLRETADVIVQQGKKLIACKGGSDSVDQTTEAEKQAYQENKRQHLGG